MSDTSVLLPAIIAGFVIVLACIVVIVAWVRCAVAKSSENGEYQINHHEGEYVDVVFKTKYGSRLIKRFWYFGGSYSTFKTNRELALSLAEELLEQLQNDYTAYLEDEL